MSDFAVGTLITRPDLNIVGQADDTDHPLCGALGIEFLKERMDEAAERSDAVLNAHTISLASMLGSHSSCRSRSRRMS